MFNISLALPQSATKTKTNKKVSVLSLNLAILFAIVILGILYLAQINSLGTKGYEIKQLDQKIKQLELEQKHLELQAANLQSIQRIQQEASKLNFVPVAEVTYIKDSDFALK